MIAGVPYDAEVEYLESTGTQWIDTGKYLNDSSVLSLRAEISSTERANRILFGACTDDATDSDKCVLLRTFSYPKTYASWLKAGVYGIGVNYPSGMVEFTMDMGHVYFNGTQAYTVDSNTSVGVPLGTVSLLSMKKQIGSWGKIICKMYGFKHVKNGAVVTDFISVRVGQVGYMYDRVSRKLFGNAGTGAFVLGPDVATPVMGLRRYPQSRLGKVGARHMIYGGN